jgi:hypothetical protein
VSHHRFTVDTAIGARLTHTGFRKRLIDVPDDIVDIFQADRQAHHVLSDAGFDLIFVVELTVGGRAG